MIMSSSILGAADCSDSEVSLKPIIPHITGDTDPCSGGISGEGHVPLMYNMSTY